MIPLPCAFWKMVTWADNFEENSETVAIEVVQGFYEMRDVVEVVSDEEGMRLKRRSRNKPLVRSAARQKDLSLSPVTPGRKRRKNVVEDSSDEELTDPESPKPKSRITPCKTSSKEDKYAAFESGSEEDLSSGNDNASQMSINEWIVPNDEEEDIENPCPSKEDEETDDLAFYRSIDSKEVEGEKSDWRDFVPNNGCIEENGLRSHSEGDDVRYMIVFLTLCILDGKVPEPQHSPEIDSFHKLQTKALSTLESAQWRPSFRDALMSYQIMETKLHGRTEEKCEGCGRKNDAARCELTVSGVAYDSSAFWSRTLSPDVLKSGIYSSKTFVLGINCFCRGTLFFLLIQLKIQMMIELKRRIDCMQEDGMTRDDIIASIAQNVELMELYADKIDTIHDFMLFNSKGKLKENVVSEKITNVYQPILSKCDNIASMMRSIFWPTPKASKTEKAEKRKTRSKKEENAVEIVTEERVDYYKMWSENEELQENLSAILNKCSEDELKKCLSALSNKKLLRVAFPLITQLVNEFLL